MLSHPVKCIYGSGDVDYGVWIRLIINDRQCGSKFDLTAITVTLKSATSHNKKFQGLP